MPWHLLLSCSFCGRHQTTDLSSWVPTISWTWLAYWHRLRGLPFPGSHRIISGLACALASVCQRYPGIWSWFIQERVAYHRVISPSTAGEPVLQETQVSMLWWQPSVLAPWIPLPIEQVVGNQLAPASAMFSTMLIIVGVSWLELKGTVQLGLLGYDTCSSQYLSMPKRQAKYCLR
jgi:hypothetical protein